MKRYVLSLFIFCGFGPVAIAEDVMKACEVTYEVFSLPLAEAAKLRRVRLGGVKTHGWLVGEVGKGKVKQERWMNLKVGGGNGGIAEEIEEFIYGSEYDPEHFRFQPRAKIGGVEGNQLFFKALPFPVPSSFPTFDTKNVGEVFECEVQNSEVWISAAHVGHLGNDSYGKAMSEWVMPRFSVQLLKAKFPFVDGKPALVGTISPPKELQKDGEKRVWLAFVTVKKF